MWPKFRCARSPDSPLGGNDIVSAVTIFERAITICAMLRNLMLLLAYDGTDFHGWQFQPELRTVQECLEQALRRTLRHRVNLLGCSRTDSGVHAAGYVANLYSPTELRTVAIMRSAGSRLPKDMSLLHVEDVPLTFHATRSSITKLYRYRIHNVRTRPCERMDQSKVYR